MNEDLIKKVESLDLSSMPPSQRVRVIIAVRRLCAAATEFASDSKRAKQELQVAIKELGRVMNIFVIQ